jgi:steroid 5-alpha reductase family enzyme
MIGKMAFAKASFVFTVSVITSNVSQVDKLWSLMPPIYAWAIVASTGGSPRQILAATLITIWGLRLTYNFGRKGGYSWKFWDGEEDYRWAVLRKKPGFSNPIVWFIFNLGFISFYQSFLIAGFTTLPMIVAI